MNSLERLHLGGQHIWLDNIRRALLTSGKLQSYIDEFAVSGLTSNPSIFERAIDGSGDYDQSIAERLSRNLSPETLFQELAIEDLQQAADLFQPIFAATGGTDGFVSLEVSPELAGDAEDTIMEARRLFASAARDNLLIKVPGTVEGLIATEELIAIGVPVNVTLLFSVEHYQATADAYLRGIERRIERKLDPKVTSIASLFVSRWDVKSNPQLPDNLKNRLGIAVAAKAYDAYRQLLQSDRWRKLEAAGAKPQKLLLASTGTKDPALPDTYYIEALALEDTINTIPEKTLLAFADHGKTDSLFNNDVAEADRVVAATVSAGIDLRAMARELQTEGGNSFSNSFDRLMRCLSAKSIQLAESGERVHF